MVVDQEVCDIISDASGQEQSAYLKAISDYLEKEADQDGGPLNIGPEKIKVLGLIAYYSTKACAGNNTSYDFLASLGAGTEELRMIKNSERISITILPISCRPGKKQNMEEPVIRNGIIPLNAGK